MSRIISVCSGKGGVGKTTVATNLAAALSWKFNNSVIAIDCNITASHLGLHLGKYYYPINLNHALRGEVDIKDVIYEHYDKMKFIPASLSLKDLKRTDMNRLKYLMDELKEEADYIILDTAPGLGSETMSVLRASEEVLFVTTAFTPSVADIIRCNEAVKEIGVRTLGIVINMSSRRDELKREEIENLVGLPVIEAIPTDKNILKSLVARQPVVFYKPKSRASKKFYSIAAHIRGEKYGEGLLRFFRR